MQVKTLSKVITWATIAWVIITTMTRESEAGPVAFSACVAQAAGPVCAASFATGDFILRIA